ncbi:transglutaminase domain-containing protein [Streptosporangium roseum]|uniref:transglutaminase domain-containing protein n=1 Tax=Streptosporangium roseum TaxID=2001 RepID=UPI00332E1D49
MLAGTLSVPAWSELMQPSPQGAWLKWSAALEAAATGDRRDLAPAYGEVQSLLAAQKRTATPAARRRIESIENSLSADYRRLNENRSPKELGSNSAALLNQPATTPHSTSWRPLPAVPVSRTGDIPSLPSSALAGTYAGQEPVSSSLEIKKLAAGLKTPSSIYSWVRKNTVSVPVWGVTQGADGCLQTRVCSPHDTSLLLSSLLRARGVETRYERGVVRMNAKRFQRAMGDFADLDAAVQFAASLGTPVSVQTNADKEPVAVNVGHIWVQAYLRHRDGDGDDDDDDAQGVRQGDHHPVKPGWVRLDASLKPLRFIRPLNLGKVTGATPAAFKRLAASVSGDPGYPAVTGADTAKLKAAQDQWRAKLSAKLQEMVRDEETVGDVIGGTVASSKSRFTGPPGRITSLVSRTADIPAGDYHFVRLTVANQSTVTVPTYRMATQRLTIAYVPASAADAKTINDNGGLTGVTPYLVDLRPVIYFNGEQQITGDPVTMGQYQSVVVSLSDPAGRVRTYTHSVAAGTYANVGISTGSETGNILTGREASFKSTSQRLEDGADVDFENVIGAVLDGHAQQYYLMVDAFNASISNQRNVRMASPPRELLMMFMPAFQYSGNTAISTLGVGMLMDAQGMVYAAVSRSGNTQAAVDTMLQSGLMGSKLESAIFEATEQTRSVSTVELHSQALAQKVPLAALNPANADTVSAKLNLSQVDRDYIAAAARNGSAVIATTSPVTYGRWTGAAWATLDPRTGATGSLIHGGLLGGGTAELDSRYMLDWNGTIRSEVEAAEGILKSVGKNSKALAKVPGVNKFLAGVIAVDQGFSTYKKTGEPLKGIYAGVTSFMISTAIGAAQSGLVAATAASVAGTGGLAALPAVALLVANVLVLEQVGTIVSQEAIRQIEAPSAVLLRLRPSHEDLYGERWIFRRPSTRVRHSADRRPLFGQPDAGGVGLRDGPALPEAPAEHVGVGVGHRHVLCVRHGLLPFSARTAHPRLRVGRPT